MAILLAFLALQTCDVATTLAFLARGVAEGNPLIAAALGMSGSPLAALLLAKAVGCALAFLAWRGKRLRLLRGVNLIYGVCVAWNMLAIALA